MEIKKIFDARKGTLLSGLCLSMFLLFSLTFVSAGLLSDWYGGITGRDTSDTTSLSVTVGNNAPTIGNVLAISAQTPTESGTKSVTFTFNATDTDGVGNLDDATAEARFQKTDETTRLNTSCVLLQDIDTTSAQYECTVGMEYFDGSGSWTINVTVDDINAARAENSSTTFTYNLLTAMVMSPTALEWGSIELTATNTSSTSNPITINNTGNDVSLSINVTGYDLSGTTTTTEHIYANNFTIDAITTGCSGVAMSNATSTNVTSTVLQSGNNSIAAGDATSGQEQLFVCLKGVPQDISSQDYSSGALAWNIQIIT